MPFYTYKCPKGHRTEEFRKVSQRFDDVKCAECSENAIKVLSPVPTTFRFADEKLKR